MRRLLLSIAGLLILLAGAVPAGAIYYAAFTESGLKFIVSLVPHEFAGVRLDIVNPSGTIALLVGNTGTFLSYQNGGITILSSGTTNNLYSVAWNPNGQYALIGGSSGSILKYNATSTIAFNTSGLYTSSATIRFIAWNPAGTLAILVGSASGVVLTYDGASLSSLPSPTSNGLYSVSWSGDTATIVGNSGTMLTYSEGVLKMAPTGLSSSFRGIAWKPA